MSLPNKNKTELLFVDEKTEIVDFIRDFFKKKWEQLIPTPNICHQSFNPIHLNFNTHNILEIFLYVVVPSISSNHTNVTPCMDDPSFPFSCFAF